MRSCAERSGGTSGAEPTQAVAGAALVTGAAAGLLVLAQALGPLALSPADAAWLLLTPLDRRDVLQRPAAATAGIGVVAGGVLGVLALAMAGPFLRLPTGAGTHRVPWAWLVLSAVGGAGFFAAASRGCWPSPGRGGGSGCGRPGRSSVWRPRWVR